MPEYLLLQKVVELPLAILQSPSVRAIDHPDKPICLLETRGTRGGSSDRHMKKYEIRSPSRSYDRPSSIIRLRSYHGLSGPTPAPHLLEVVPPIRPDGLLSAHIPHVELVALVCKRLDVEAKRWFN